MTRRASDRFMAIVLVTLTLLVMCYAIGILAMGTDNQTAVVFGTFAGQLVVNAVASALFPDRPSSSEKPFVMGYLYFMATMSCVLAAYRLSDFADQPFPIMVLRRIFPIVLACLSVSTVLLNRICDTSHFWTIVRSVYGVSCVFRLITVGILHLLDAKHYPPGVLSFRLAALSACFHGSMSIIFTTSNRHCIGRGYDRLSKLVHRHVDPSISSACTSFAEQFSIPKGRNVPRPQSRFLSYPGSQGWQWYDNNGAYNVLADRCPSHLRIGRWSPLVVPMLVCAQIVLVVYLPGLQGMGSNLPMPPVRSYHWWFDFSSGCWGLFVISICYYRNGFGMQCLSYTWCSWCILTCRNLMVAMCSVQAVRDSVLGDFMAFVTESLRFPAIVGAAAIFVLWNFLIVPSGLLLFWKEDRRNLIYMITSFGNLNMHTVNGVIVLVSCGLGGPGNGVRLLGPADLWMGFATLNCYCLLYLLYLDRIGVHLYFVFSPRAKVAVFVYPLVLGVYVGSYHLWNMFILYLNGEADDQLLWRLL